MFSHFIGCLSIMPVKNKLQNANMLETTGAGAFTVYALLLLDQATQAIDAAQAFDEKCIAAALDNGLVHLAVDFEQADG